MAFFRAFHGNGITKDFANEIIENLYLGDFVDAENFPMLIEKGITVIINMVADTSEYINEKSDESKSKFNLYLSKEVPLKCYLGIPALDFIVT
jgi:hypothetical protein